MGPCEAGARLSSPCPTPNRCGTSRGYIGCPRCRLQSPWYGIGLLWDPMCRTPWPTRNGRWIGPKHRSAEQKRLSAAWLQKGSALCIVSYIGVLWLWATWLFCRCKVMKNIPFGNFFFKLNNFCAYNKDPSSPPQRQALQREAVEDKSQILHYLTKNLDG